MSFVAKIAKNQKQQQPCRLCLHYTVEDVDSPEPMIDIFATDDPIGGTLNDKIRDCLGIFIAPSDDDDRTVRFVCSSCARTVELIDEFRILCHQTAEMYDSIRIRSSKASEQRKQYCAAVSTLRACIWEVQCAVDEALCKTKSEDNSVDPGDVKLESDLESPPPSIKSDTESNCEQPVEFNDLSGAGADPGIDFVAVKIEALDPVELETPTIEPIAATEESSDCERLTGTLKMAIVKEVKQRPELWDITLASSAETISKMWAELARKYGLEVGTLRRHWRRIREGYRDLQRRESIGDNLFLEDATTAELFQLCKHMFDSALKQPLPSEQLKIAENVNSVASNENQQRVDYLRVMYKHPVIWNVKHIDYPRRDSREHAWDQISKELNVPCEDAKRTWRNLRDMYRVRARRLARGKLPKDESFANGPFFKLLDEMVKCYPARGISKNSTAVVSSDKQDAASGVSYKVFENDRKLKFAQICYGYEIVWNNRHPDYNINAKKDPAWDEIAQQMEITRAEARYQWSRLRGVYRGRRLRLLDGSIALDDPILNDPLYKLLEDMLGENMQIGQKSGTIMSAQQHAQHGPFESIERQIELLEEISQREIIWNGDHPDNRKVGMRTGAWNEVAAKFDVNPLVVKSEWKRLKDVHSCREDQTSPQNAHDANDQRLLALIKRLVPVSETAPVKPPEKPLIEGKRRRSKLVTEPKRRFRGKKTYDSVGCVKMDRNGTMRHHKICELCGKLVERSLFEYHMNQHNGIRPYACSFEGCDKQYSNKITRDRHEVMVHVEDGFKFECDQCGAKFKQRARFEFHYAIKHKSDEVPCDICGKILKHRHLLRKHKELHTSSFTCKVCGKVLQKKWSLHVHMRVHTQEKPFPCELCELRFMLKVQMKTHLLKVHGVLLEDIEAAKANIKNAV
ncbi:uncharacterized protein LOC128741607 isoform X2 [Sabethes cyaneus]|uniref:uncharacterized protein LOC128741607 isoform X2 n=1 Tax=Sabethes cyaneus TaxID=53552 RepID=UPI00237EDDB3|nr:uncharacterized protein LOC128741607 isoform X2 [Sabethes cyaneus]